MGINIFSNIYNVFEFSVNKRKNICGFQYFKYETRSTIFILTPRTVNPLPINPLAQSNAARQ